MPIRLEIVTGERLVYQDTVDIVIAPGVEGELGVLPRHAALMTMLQPGQITVRKAGIEEDLAVSGGFMEVLPHKVTVLADTAERAEEIDIARAEAARERAQRLLEEARRGAPGIDIARVQASMRRAQVRLKVAQRRRRPASM